VNVRLFLLCIACGTVLLLVGCGVTRPTISINGSGDIVTLDENLSGFSQLEVSHTFQVNVSQGDAFRVIVRVDDNVVEYLDVATVGKTLKIGLDSDRNYDLQRATIEAEVTMPKLNGLELSGASKVTVTGFVSQQELDIDLSGASVLNGDILTNDASVDLSGSSQIALSGSARNLRIGASGASVAHLADFQVGEATVEASGASVVTVNASSRLDAEASGASQVHYLGSPTLGRQETSGASVIRAD
jgi:hypothetical protein